MWFLSDEIYLSCIKLAMKSKSKTQRYGAVLVNDNCIIGKGYNHRNTGNELIDMRKGNLGNHAEVHALDCALRAGVDVKNSVMYAAGYLVKNKQLFIRQELNYSCIDCPPLLKKYGVELIYVPLVSVWAEMTIDQAFSFAKEFKNNNENNLIGRESEATNLYLEELLNIL